MRSSFGILGSVGCVASLTAFVLWACPPTAQAQPAAGPDIAGRQYAAAAALQNREQYDLAADEWAQFLKSYPSDRRAARARHYLGVCQLKNKDYAAAAESFAALVGDKAQLPAAALDVELEGGAKANLAEPSYLYLGLAEYNAARGAKSADDARPRLARAAQALATLNQKFPQSKYAAQALFYEGEIAYAQGRKPDALARYEQFVRRFPDDELAPDALYAWGTTNEELGQTDAARKAFGMFLQKYPEHPLAPEVMVRQGEALLTAGQAADAERLFAAAAAKLGFALADHATMRQAAALYQQKRYAAAAELYASVPTRFANSKHIAAAWLAAGKCFYLADRYPEAEAALDKARGAGGETTTEAVHWQARSYLKQKQPQAALKLLDAAMAKAGAKPDRQLQLDRADALYDDPQTRAHALQAYAALADANPTDDIAPQARYLAALAALETRDYARAAREAQAFVTRWPQHDLLPDVLYVAAEAKLLDGQAADAERAYRELLAKFPKRSDAANWRVRLGQALVLERKYQETIDALGSLAAVSEKSDLVAEARFLVGTSLDALGRSDEAASQLKASLEAGPHWRQADETLLALAAAYRHQEKLPEARATLNRLLRDFPDSVQLADRARYRLADYAFASGDYAAAEADYLRVIDGAKDGSLRPAALYGLGWSQLKRGDRQAAAATLDRLLDAYPKQELAARAHYARALARQDLKNYAGAIADAEAFLATKPEGADRSDARYVLGVCQASAKQAAEAVKTFRALLSDDPKYAGADKVLYELGWALESLGRQEEAAKSFGELARKYRSSPLAAESLYHVGEYHYDRKEYEKAAAAFYDAMQAGKGELAQAAAYKLGWAYFHAEQFAPAAQTFGFYRGTYPSAELASDAAFVEGEALAKLGKTKEAIAAYAEVKKPKRADLAPLALLHAAQAYGRLGDWQKDLELAEQARRAYPQGAHRAELLYELAWAKQNLGKTDEALPLYDEVTTLSDGEVAARARFMIGEIHFEKKEHAEAVRHFFKVAYGFNGFPEWQAAAQYEAGRCFEVLGKLDQARKSYRDVVDNYPKSNKVGLARERLAALGSGAK